MLRDVFYFGEKPNAHPRERPARDLDHARSLCTSDHFWIINEFCDYSRFDWEFDFEFLPDNEVWAQDHNNVWPSVYQKDSGTWLCSKEESKVIIYRNDVDPLKRKNVKHDSWVLLDKVDTSKFDFGWHPDPTDPPYIYRWGNKYYPVELGGALEYHVKGATQVKYMKATVELLPDWDRWQIPNYIDKNSFDFSWRPDPREPALIYEFGTQWQKNGGPRYASEDATEVKYIDGLKAMAKPMPDDPNWHILPQFKLEHFDYTWHPDSTSPPYIYVFGNKYYDAEICPTIEYRMPGATEKKYVKDCWASLGPNLDNWHIPENIDVKSFDFSWIPNPGDPPYIYQFGTQHQKTGGPRFVVDGATELKYIDTQVAVALPRPEKFTVLNNIKVKDFDYSWHPDATEDSYIYVFGNNLYDAEDMPTVQYAEADATVIKYVHEVKAKLDTNLANWQVPDNIDVSSFDFSWVPKPNDPAYIYQFGTQHQKTGGPRYVVEGASEIKYMDNIKAVALPTVDNWKIAEDITIESFDFSWHPDTTESPYIYVFGNQWYSADVMNTVSYVVPGATELKYIDTQVANLGNSFTNWQIPKNVDASAFDFSWKPNPNDPPYIYYFSTQHQKTGGPRYVVPGATEAKYMDFQSVVALPDPSKFTVLENYVIKDFDYSWHPDATEEPYIYVFGNDQYPAETMPTIEYRAKGATQVKYIHAVKAKLGEDKSNWEIPDNIDASMIDFSWKPNPKDPAYIYQFGTQWQKTGGPRYVVEGATEIKYVDIKAKALPTTKNWYTIDGFKIKEFDYSWHPDTTEEPYIYVFGNNFYDSEKCPTIEYRVPGATKTKYVKENVATLAPNLDNWLVPNYVDTTGFDFSWIPDPKDPPYIYQFGTQWQKDGGPQYIKIKTQADFVHQGADIKYIDSPKVKAMPNLSKWTIPKNIDIESFDFSWHPEASAPPLNYVFGTQWAVTGGPIYKVPGAEYDKYIDVQKAKAIEDKSRWFIPDNLDTTNFDFSWHPSLEDQPYIYEFGTQHQKTGGPRYLTEGATEYKYIDLMVAKRLPKMTNNWIVAEDIKIKDFDYSWHPDNTDEPYIYVFGNNQYPAEIMPTVYYMVPGATQTKYVNNVKATLDINMDRWVIPDDVDITGFDYSWIPNPKDPPFVYQFGTQWQKTGGPKFVAAGADKSSPVKYIDTMKVRKLPHPERFEVINDYKIKEFDYSWHPDDTAPPFIYIFGNNQYPSEVMPTMKYVVPEATTEFYINNNNVVLDTDMRNWFVPDDVDASNFDFSWKPNPKDPAMIYQFGTQHQKTGGPRYVVEGATEIKYVDKIVKKLPHKEKFDIKGDLLIEDFDWSWHPDDSAPPYIYVFGNQHHPGEVMPTIEYYVDGASTYKYVPSPVAKLAQDKRNWVVPKNVDISEFDFSWKPNPYDPPYIYRFGTQWQKTGGPSYPVPKATEVKYVDYSKAKALPNPNDPRWQVPENCDVTGFDFSWHPDTTERPYIYQFGTQWQKTNGPRYVMPGATQTKYIEGNVAKALPTGENWDIPAGIDIDSFDFSWHPDMTIEKPYIYQFGTQWQKTGGPRYMTPGIDKDSEVKYVDTNIVKAIKLPNKANWEIPDNIDVTSVDYTWHPDDTEQPYIYQFGTQWHDRGGPRYIVSGATEYKYSKDITGKLLPNTKNWDTLLPIDEQEFDYSWAPHPNDPPYIYVFGNQWNPPEIEPTMEYFVEGATEYKYVHELKAKALPDKRRWTILHAIDEDSFDFSWRPNPKDPPYIYVFGNTQYSAEKMPTLEYRIEGATEYKYINDIKAKLAPVMDNWRLLMPVDKEKFDFSWVPDPGDPAYIYVFGNQWHAAEIEPTIEYRVPGATEVKYISDITAYVLADMSCWVIPDNVDTDGFDLTWRPDPKSPAYIYEFATVWHDRGGPRYVVPGATDFKYIEDVKARTKATRKNWVIPEGINVDEFDFTWVPHPDAPPYIYQFGTLINDDDGPRYVTPGHNNEIVRLERVYRKFDYKESYESADVEVRDVVIPRYVLTSTIEDLINDHPNEIFWAIRENIDYSRFDFTWKPSIEQARYIHVFGSPDSELTQTYFVSAPMWKEGHREFNYVEGEKKADTEYLATLFKPSDMFFVDRGNPESRERFEQLKQKFPDVQKTRFLNSWVDTINRCINRSNTELCWILNSEYDYTDFNFNYYPNEWQLKMVHVFGTQWSHWGNTYIVNRDTFGIDTKYVKIIEHLSNLNFVKDRQATATNNLFDIWLVDHGNDLTEVKRVLESKSCGKRVNVIKYDTNYLQTFRNLVKEIPDRKEDYIWLCSSICDYSNFDFSYTVDPFARDNLHVFPSDRQKFGDTFFVDVNKTKEIINDIAGLKEYHKVNYNQTLRTKRLPAPVLNVESDTHVGALDTEFAFPYIVMQTEVVPDPVDIEPISLWDAESKNILITATGATRIIVPKEAKDIVKKELYDYPYIKTASKLSNSGPLDIVFLSNGEQCADENYAHLLAVTKHLRNRVTRVDGVDGRVAAYHAALEVSKTPWAFTVFAKLKINPKFDFGWQPDRLQIPKHYIFHAKNPLNGLEYGHQGMIAYNKKLTLANQGKGLDFTLDDPHETVELLSGTATFNTDPYSTWRTAFREVIKLKSDYSDIAAERLNAWLTVAEGEFAECCLLGAKDAVEYYDEVMGDIEELKKSYEWSWLKDYYRKKHK